MTDCFLNNSNQLTDFIGTILGALIGGFIAYLIARFQFKKQEKQLEKKESKDNREKEIQLLWQIYFDIKKDCENSKLWENYDKLLHKKESIWGTPTAEYISDTLQYIMRDVKNYFQLLQSKDNEYKDHPYNELDLLWIRAGQLLIFLFKIYEKMINYNKEHNEITYGFYKEANSLYQQHNELIIKKK